MGPRAQPMRCKYHCNFASPCFSDLSLDSLTRMFCCTYSAAGGGADMLGSMTGSMTGSFTGTSSRSETGTLRRGNSMRRFLSNHAGIKRRSQAILIKYQTVSIRRLSSESVESVLNITLVIISVCMLRMDRL